MRTDLKLLTIEDLCRELGVVYRDAGRRREEIVAEIARRIRVRDLVVRCLMDRDYLGGFEAVGVKLHRDSGDDALTYYDENGEQIL